MADGDQYESDETTDTTTINGGESTVKERGEGEEERYNSSSTNNHVNGGKEDEEKPPESEGLYDVVSKLMSSIFFPDRSSGLASGSFFNRVGVLLRENLPHLREASRTSGLEVLKWARNGSPLRLLLVISVGTITLLTLTGILVFLLCLAAATFNAIVVSLFISLAAAGGFLAVFFTSVAVVYIGTLSVAAFVISSVTVSAVITALIVTGWIGFFFTVWMALKKSAGLAKHSVGMTSLALSAWQSHRHRRNHSD